MQMHSCLGWLCIVLSIGLSSGKKCFQCQDLPHPSDCRQLADCPDTDECFVEELITGGGTVLYNTGCRPKQRCKGAGRRDIVARADIITCDECCADEFCNLEGCGQTAPSRNTRGPYCFACSAQSGQTTCRNVKMCAADQVCLIGYSETDQFYATSCITQPKPAFNSQQCHAIQTHVHPIPVGRRDTFTFTTCSTCCPDDFCNTNCTHVVIPLDGQWSEWSPWTPCSATCDHGIQTRHRACDNPQPLNNGKACTGNDKMSTSCTATHKCPIDGHWSVWGDWSSCSATCENGFKARHRTCNNPSPQHHGKQCLGSTNMTTSCSATHTCPIITVSPVDGHWSIWGHWSSCSVTCGNGSKTRHRKCNSPHPQHNGKQCEGNTKMSHSCSAIQACHVTTIVPIDGHWSEWGNWSACSVTCGHGFTKRYRVCNNPQPQHNGHFCPGHSMMSTSCPAAVSCQTTDPTHHWSAWGSWTHCSKSCGYGFKERRRTCNALRFAIDASMFTSQDVSKCTGQSVMSSSCVVAKTCSSTNPTEGQWSQWGSWAPCSKSCGHGVRQRHRTCNSHIFSSSTSLHTSEVASKCNGQSVMSSSCLVANTCPSTTTCHRHQYDWFSYPSTVHGCLKLYKVRADWNDGQKLCRGDGAELYAANDRSKQHLMERYLRQQGVHGQPGVWLGLMSTFSGNGWHWTGPKPLPLTYSNFHNASLSSVHNTCAITVDSHYVYYWYRQNCYMKHYVLCELLH